MAAPTYGTDLALIDDAQDVTSYAATGGGAAALNDETDYFINDSQCVSKNGFTLTQKGMVHDDVSAPTITSGDAVFIWGRQANRNILNTVALSGGAVIMGTSNSVFAGFNVDGSDVEGSNLLSWVSYAVDPTQSSSYTSGSPGAASTWDHFGMEWDILGSGALKGAPNAVGVSRHGRELTVIDGDLGNGYGTFEGAGSFDAAITRRWGILTPVAGGYLFHGAFVMGTTTSVDFRDSDRSISVLDDAFVPAGFNEFEIRHTSSNVEWTAITITALGTTDPFTLTLDVGTFTGEGCSFSGAGTTTFASTGSMTNSKWSSCGRINLAEADISGSSILTSSVAADEGAVFDDRTTTGAVDISELDNCTFSIGAASHHAVRWGTGVDDDITLTGMHFNGFSSTADATNATLRFDATTGSMNVNLIDCFVDGNPATTGNVGVDDAAGIAVTLVVNPVTTKVTVVDAAGDPIENARVLAETSDTGGGSGFPYQASTTSLTQAAGTATCTTTAAHLLSTGDYVVIRGAGIEGYNKQASITVTGGSTFTYSVDSGLGSPATGTPVVSYAALSGLTNSLGVIQSSKTWPAAQGLSGRCRKSTAEPYFKTGRFTITDASGGSDVTVQMITDE